MTQISQSDKGKKLEEKLTTLNRTTREGPSRVRILADKQRKKARHHTEHERIFEKI